MARGVNTVILIGNVGQDPEVRYMQNGNAVANVSLGVSESWTDQQGQKQERTEWCRLVFYKRLAEVVGEYVRKGSKLYVSGKLQTREWQDQQGQKRSTTEIIVNDMQLLDSRPANGQGYAPPQNQPQGQAQGQQQGWGAPQGQPQGQRPPQGQAQPQGYQQQQGYQEPPMNFDDDIPF